MKGRRSWKIKSTLDGEVAREELCAFKNIPYICTYLEQSKWLKAKLGIERVLTLLFLPLIVALDDKDSGMGKKEPCSLQRH